MNWQTRTYLRFLARIKGWWIVRLFLCVTFAFFASVANGVTVSNKVVMVDQEGNVNAPEVLATTAQLATNEVKIIAAAESARVAEQTSLEVTNAVQGIVSAIVNNNVIVYRSGFNDSFGTVVSVSANCKCAIYNFVPGTNGGATRTHQIYYALTEDIGATKPRVRTNDTFTDLDEDVYVLDDSSVSEPVLQGGRWTDSDGNVYSYLYRIDVTVPSTGAHFFKVIVNASTPSGDGYTFDIANGIQGGMSTTVTWGEKTLTFKGGLLVGVE